MLILTRKIGETIIIDGDIKVIFIDVQGNQVRLGIDAPKDVKVYREELYYKIFADKSPRTDTKLTTNRIEVP